MTREEKIKVLAELDGWGPTLKTIPVWEITGYDGSGEYVNREVVVYENGTTAKKIENLPTYLTSYDAIIPLIQKLQHPSVGWSDLQRSTPEQLADALIKAVGKWRE